MNFSRAKIIIIACLLVVNIVLGVFCITLRNEKAYISQEEAELASSHLAGQGISVVFNNDFRRIYNLPIFSLDISSENEGVPPLYRSFTEAFFGVSVGSTEYVNTPDGYSVSVMDGDGNIIGTASLGGACEIECFYNGYLDEADMAALSSHYLESALLDTANNSAEKTAKRFIETSLNKESSEYAVSALKNFKEGTLVCFSKKLEKTGVLDLYINVFVSGGEVKYCFAKIFENTPVRAYSADLIDCVDAMYVFSEMQSSAVDKEGEEIIVEDISMVYKMIEYTDGNYYIIPAWLIEYYDSQGKRYCAGFDAIIGENQFLLEQN